MVWEQYELLRIADYSFGSSVEKKAVTVFTGMLERGDDVMLFVFTLAICFSRLINKHFIVPRVKNMKMDN